MHTTSHPPTYSSVTFILLLPLNLLPPFFFFFNDTATTEIYTLSLHDALPIYDHEDAPHPEDLSTRSAGVSPRPRRHDGDRKSTRLNSSHLVISYAVFCLKKKKKNIHSSWCGDN